ncbi:hypothetical protein MMAG44476_21832 [Mycolicibacterium mageritense DSM 44476 = CIP 104973]|uniref:Uncharacterized protein n=1 Tax=Mycolicibacterium canariasense TaxID=228230 RepID=A0A124E1W0_MYCCR|nr:MULTISPECIES: hypothetical protein [Mycolicibacterium]MCC9179551.1 hypothetical protein [Mycolicibacterium mageritense]MCV7211444.1 hypothetical protein [Mycolicibacterium canariasense]ORV10476.1 hypothetical protein AWB94_07195 [Mycolicibacterium canariasense]GAS94895.1 uncharacterized protein RMCC_1861 [Mycolicibacterium canariasense]
MGERYERNDIPDLSAIGGQWDPREPRNHGGDYVVPRRLVAVLPGRNWPNTPEQCTAGHLDTEWIHDGQVLLCTGCGIDAT